ncbi:MAG TPA: hypothetical protein DCY61_01420 [Dehalococcoidia bacterium]|nr:hypothetical protein [Dehalococcoidia bacterium]
MCLASHISGMAGFFRSDGSRIQSAPNTDTVPDLSINLGTYPASVSYSRGIFRRTLILLTGDSATWKYEGGINSGIDGYLRA